jgi:general secretion pathway protein I
MMRHAGFTLIEVLVALTIFAVGVLATLRGIGTAASGIDDQRTRLMAGWVAQNRLADMRAMGRFPPVGTNEGEAPMGRQTFFWREETHATPNPLFRRVEVGVFTSLEDTHALARLSGFAVQPYR